MFSLLKKSPYVGLPHFNTKCWFLRLKTIVRLG